MALTTKLATLCVIDDGVGLLPDAEFKRGHYGLRERVEGLGGSMTVGAAHARGTRLVAQIPVIA